MDPEPTANTFAIGTSRKRGNIEGLQLAGNAIVCNGEDDEVLGLHVGLVGLVGNSESASSDISILKVKQ